MSIINIEDKIITFDQQSVEIADGKFIAIANACLDMITQLLFDHIELVEETSLIGMETPPVMARFTEKLWSLDTLLYRTLYKPYVFNVAYIKFIHGTSKYNKKDTINLINEIIQIFIDNGYKINQLFCSEKTGKPRKMTDNESDATVYAVRMFIKYHLENNIESKIVDEILKINPRFKEIKEEF